MSYIEELNSEEILKKVKDKDEIFQKLQKQYDEIVQQQVDLFNKYIEKLLPCMEFIHSRRYRFMHPSINYLSSRGPILGYNSKNNYLYVYDFECKYPRKINMYNTDETDFASYKEIFELEGFEKVIEGLLYILKMHERLITETQKEINLNKLLIDKYNID